MTPQEIDAFCKSELVVRNPWKIGAKQCLVLHLVCTYGTIKAAAEATGIKERTLKWNLKTARGRRKMSGTDVRIFLMWDRYAQGVRA